VEALEEESGPTQICKGGATGRDRSAKEGAMTNGNTSLNAVKKAVAASGIDRVHAVLGDILQFRGLPGRRGGDG
jgi:hypothetical protein